MIGTKTVAERINYVHTLLHGEALREFDELSSQNTGTKNAHPRSIQETLIGIFFQLTLHPRIRYPCNAL